MRCCWGSIRSTSLGWSWARTSPGNCRKGTDEASARCVDPRADGKGRDLMADFDLFVIGAGSGGVRAARVAAAYGARVAIAEEYKVGGTCVIRGCVPKKLLVYGAHFAEDLDDAAMFGWDVPQKRFDWPVLRDNVLAEVGRLEGAYTDTLTNHKVTIFHERAELTGPNASGWRAARKSRPTKSSSPPARGRHAGDRGHRACDQLERGVPPRRAAEAHRDCRRRLYRQRIRRHFPPVRKPRDPGQSHRRHPAPLRPADRRPAAADLAAQGDRFPVQRDHRPDRAARRWHAPRRDDRLRRYRGRPAAVRDRPQAEHRGARARCGRRRAGRQRPDQGRRRQSHIGSVDLRGRRRHRPRAADAGRDPRGAGVRRHLLRQEAAPASIMVACRRRCSAIRRSPGSA